jgi:hypothetical protein
MAGNDNIYYSPIRRVDSSDSSVNLVTFNAQMVNHLSVFTNWTSYVDGFADHYLLERSVGDNAYTVIDNALSYHHYGQQYNFTDLPQTAISTGTLIHYRLTAVMEDGTTIILPEQAVEWVNGNAFVNIYPNPSHDGRFTINWYADAGTQMQVNITDMLGRSLYKTTVTAAQWNNATSIQAAYLADGLYNVSMNIGGRKYAASIVIE